MMLICIDAKISINNQTIEIDHNVHLIKRDLYDSYKASLIEHYKVKYKKELPYKNDKGEDAIYPLTVDFNTFEVADTIDINKFTKDELFKERK